MADEGPLSQADIDALTAGLLGGAGDGFDPDALRPELDLILEQAAGVIGTILNRSASFALRDMKSADAAALSAFGAEGLCLRVSLEGLDGDLAFGLSKATAALLAGLMMGGDGAAPFKDEDLDAVNELGNQIMGAVCTALGGKHGRSVSASQAQTAALDPGDPPFPAEGAALAELELAIEGAEAQPLFLLLSQPLAAALTGASPGGSSDGAGALLASEGGYESAPSRGLSIGDVPPNIQMLLDINLNITIELGRTRLSIRKILELGPGSIIELDRPAGRAR